MKNQLQIKLNNLVEIYNNPNFIENDPICIPHNFSLKQDIEISGLFASVFAWGLRKTIINKTKELMLRMDNSPYDFIINHTEKDLKKLLDFKHRTFNDTDLLYFVDFLKRHYSLHDSLESAFIPEGFDSNSNLKDSLVYFYNAFTNHENFPERTKKHITTPAKNSACKRICMFLRWMVRNDNKGVDFGIWESIKPSQLVIPLDLHVMRSALRFSLISEEKSNWKTATELTNSLKKFDKNDPVKYDFALFALSINK